jgi:hypothetical protein
MRKISLLIMVITAIMLLPAVTQGDQQLSALVTVTLNDVLDIDVDPALNNITVNQDPELENQVSQMDLGTVFVKVYAISNWKLGLCYVVGGNNKVSTYPFETDPIYEYQPDEGESYDMPTEDKNFVPECAGLFGIGNVDEVWGAPHDKSVKVKAEGTNNTNSPYEHDIGFGIHLDNLGDRVAGENLRFDLHFAVIDPTV